MKVLIATDGSDFSRAAVKKCCEIVGNAEKTEIKVISLYQAYIPLDTFPQSVEYAEKFESELRQKPKNMLRRQSLSFVNAYPREILN